MSEREYDPGMRVVEFDATFLKESTGLFMHAFSKPPWNDVFESEEAVSDFFKAFLAWPNFKGFQLLADDRTVAGLSVGFIKPWLKEGKLRYEYFIDQFCIDPDIQGKGLGTFFLRHIEDCLRQEGIHDMILNTGLSSPAFYFYKKAGFTELADFGFLAKEL